MVFNDTTNKNGLIQQCEINVFGESPFGQISGNTNRLAIFTSFINEAYSRYVILAMMSDNRWQFDDFNATDLPIATTNIVSGQQDYSLGSDQVIIEQIELKDSAGVWHGLSEIKEEVYSNNDVSLTQHLNTAVTGLPYEYQKVANSIFLNPTPNFSVTGGLKIRFKRPPSYFVSSDTTKVPGFTSLHATYLSDYAVWKYSLSKGLQQTGTFAGMIQQWESEKIPEFYDKRSEEHSKKLFPAYRTSR